MTQGGCYQTRDGKFHFKNIINKVVYGSKIFSANMKGYVVVSKPNSHAYTASLSQRTQILYTPDISMVIHRLGLKPGCKVVESGTGTGSLSVSLCKTVLPKGKLFTFEFNELRVTKAIQDFKNLGLD